MRTTRAGNSRCFWTSRQSSRRTRAKHMQYNRGTIHFCTTGSWSTLSTARIRSEFVSARERVIKSK